MATNCVNIYIFYVSVNYVEEFESDYIELLDYTLRALNYLEIIDYTKLTRNGDIFVIWDNFKYFGCILIF